MLLGEVPFNGLVYGVELFEPAERHHCTAVAILPKRIRVVGHHQQCGSRPTRHQRSLTTLAETLVAGRGDLVDQVAIEINRERTGEGQSRIHPCRIRPDGHAHIASEFGKILNEGKHVVHGAAVNAGDEPHVVRPRETALKTARIADGPGHAHVALDPSGGRLFDTRQQSQQRRLARTIVPANTNRLTPFRSETDVVENDAHSLPGAIMFANAIEADHAPDISGQRGA